MSTVTLKAAPFVIFGLEYPRVEGLRGCSYYLAQSHITTLYNDCKLANLFYCTKLLTRRILPASACNWQMHVDHV